MRLGAAFANPVMTLLERRRPRMIPVVQSDLPTGTVTFLFTDVEGSTRLLEKLGAEVYAKTLAEHRKVIREACLREGGMEVDMQGDACFFAFPTAPGALAAAAFFTEELASGPIHVRVGVHTGTPLLTEEGYVGHGLHVAARIAAAGHGGQVLISASSASLVETELTDLGEHRFKDLGAPQRVFQLGHREFPALKSLYATNLPVPATPFLGREEELAEVASLISRDDARLITLTGPGGTGKTRLGLQAAAAASDGFPDGVFWVPLASLRDPGLVLVTVAEAMSIREQPHKSPLESLGGWLAGKQVLLILDNAEHLMPAVARDVAALLAAAAPLTLVVTSRERLRVAGEHVYAVPTLDDEDSVTLFLARARAVDPAISHSPVIDELCERLDHLPLALELAAARIGLLSPEQLLERLGARLDTLKGGHDADPRQQTLRTTIAWSHELLGAAERETFARMTVFAGGCTLDTAETVCGSDLETLHSLLDKSLLRRRDTEHGPRIWMLETIREFAAEQLAASSPADETTRRHFEHYLGLAMQVYERSETAEYELDRIEAERDNLRLALDTALALDPESAVSLAGWLGPYWGQRGHYGEGRGRLAAALAAAPDAAAPARALALRMAGSLARWQSDLDAAELLGREALMLDRELGNRREVGRDLNLLGVITWYRGDLAEATRLLEESLNEDRMAGGGSRPPDALFHLMAVANASGDHARTIELGRQLVARSRGRDDHLVAFALNVLGLSLEASGEIEGAEKCFEESIAVSRSRGLRETNAYALASLAHLMRGTQPSNALAHYRESMELMGELGDQRGIAYCLEGMAAIIHRQDARQSAMLLAAATAIRERTSAALNPDEQAEVDLTIAQTRDALGVDGFGAAWLEGCALDNERAVALAIGLTID
jgi:predicted ATPase/class 3 adenylate cyclase